MRGRHPVRGLRTLFVFVPYFIVAAVIVGVLRSVAASALCAVVQFVTVAVAAVLAFRAGETREIVVHETGYRARRWLRSDVVVRFDAVRDVFRRFDTMGPLGVVRGCSIELVGSDGARLNVPYDIDASAELVEHVDRHVVRAVRLEALRAYEDGEELTFGRLRVSVAGVAWGAGWRGRRDAWAEIRRIRVTARELTVHYGRWFGSRTVPLGKLPFPMVLLALLEQAPVELELVGGLR